MKFAHPSLINLLWVLIPIFGIMIYGLRQRKKIINAFLETKMQKIMASGYDPKRRWIKSILIIVALGFAVIALAGPQMGFRWEKVEQKGVDIMIALDVSKSMLAQDIKPNRLERAKREIIDLLKMMKSDRAGLVAFSGKALLQCPLTLDHEAFNIFLRVLEPGYLPIGGTNLSEAIQTSFDGFEKDTDTQKAIILITDGENTSGDVEKIAKQMAKENIKIFCIGVGDPGGAPIPDEKGGFKKDSSGNIVMSKVDEKGLERLANLTNGAYVQSVAGDMDLDLIYIEKILGTMTRKTLTSGKKKVWENRYQWFLFPCFILLLIELAISSGKRKPHKRTPGKRKISKMIFILFFIIFSFHTEPAQADSVFSSVTKGIEAFSAKQYENAKKYFIDAQLEQPDNPKHYYNIGTAAYMNQEFDQAEKNLIQAAKSTDPQINHDALYNLANTYYKMGKYDESIKGYEQILEKFPEDIQTKENLEFVKKKKEEEQNQKDQENKDQENKNQENKDQNKDDKQDKNKKKQNKEENQDQKKQQDQQNKEDKKNQEEEKSEDNQDSSKDKENDQPEDQSKEQNNTGDDEKEQEPESSQSASPSEAEEKESEQAKQNLENKLNRLEDKPGQAMMPLIQDKYVEKDW